eukprot:4458182-Amphidinium_carterae.1
MLGPSFVVFIQGTGSQAPEVNTSNLLESIMATKRESVAAITRRAESSPSTEAAVVLGGAYRNNITRFTAERTLCMNTP